MQLFSFQLRVSSKVNFNLGMTTNLWEEKLDSNLLNFA